MNPATAEQVVAPRADAMEVLLTLSPAQYRELGSDLGQLRESLGLPKSASTTQIFLEAIHRQACAG